jgi:hypothetical protein
MKEWES